MLCKNTFVTWFLVLGLLVLFIVFFPVHVSAADSNATNVSTYEALQSAVSSASTDGTEINISITEDINITSTIDIPANAKVTLIGNGGGLKTTVSPIFTATDATADSPVFLAFRDLKVEGTTAPSDFSSATTSSVIFKAAKKNSKLEIYGTSEILSDGAAAVGSGKGSSCFVYIYGGTVKTYFSANTRLYPTTNISLESKTEVPPVVAQDDVQITKVSGTNITIPSVDVLNNATSDAPYSIPITDSNAKYTLAIEVTPKGNTTPTVMGSLIVDKPAYNCGDTVKVTAKLTPDAVAKLSSGSLKFSYDTEKLTFTEAVVNKALKEGQATLYENTPGTCVASFKGDPLDVTTEGLVLAEFSFEAVKDGTADFGIIEAVAADEKASPCTTNTGDSLSVIINALPKVTTADFGSDYKMVKYVADALPGEGNAYFIGDTVLTYVPAYATGDNAGKYIFVMLSKDEPTDTTVTTKAGTYGTIAEATGDANGDTKTNIIDAQVVYYMTTKKITSSDTGFDWLNSDVNGSCTLDALDAHAIQYFVHYGKFGQFSS